jgi:hypothetical protein
MTAVLKGPYYRKVGKHTERFCRRASKQAKNPKAKGVLLLAAISADEWFGSLLGYSKKRSVAAFSQRVKQEVIDSKQMAKLLRAYVSIILTLITPYKALILEQAKLSEADFIKLWCNVFQYGAEDMVLFDSGYLPTFQARGFEGLMEMAGQQLFQGIYVGSEHCSAEELQALKNVLIDDVTAILRSLNYKPDQAKLASDGVFPPPEA